MEVSTNNTQTGCSDEIVAMLESRVSRLEESMNRAVGDLLPKVEALLSERNEGGGSTASSPAPPPSAAAPAPSLLELAERGDGETLFRVLADEQVDVRSIPPRTESGDTPLHVAASGGHLKAVMALLGVDVWAHVDALGHRLRTPLHCAAAHGHLAVTRRLLYAGAKVDVKDADGATALELAVGKGSKEVVELFLKKGVPVDTCNGDGESLLVQAARAKRWEIVDLLLERGASPTKCKAITECALVLASRDGQAESVRSLLLSGAGSEAEQVKCALGETKSAAVVWVFVDVVADQVREAGCWSMKEIVRKGHLEPLVALLEAGIDIDARDELFQTALHHAAATGHVECVRELLGRGADANAKSTFGELTPLHWASVKGHAECVRALLAAGANSSERNDKGMTPLELATTEEVRRAFNID